MFALANRLLRLVSNATQPHLVGTDDGQILPSVVFPPVSASPADFSKVLAVIVHRLQFCETHPDHHKEEDSTMDDLHALMRIAFPDQATIWAYLKRHHAHLLSEIQRLNYNYACIHEKEWSERLILLIKS